MNRTKENKRIRPIYGAQTRTITFYLCLKRFFLHICKVIGLFSLSERLTRRGVRILCYHGFSMADESTFSRRTFITSETFERRMAFLARKDFRVLVLGEALDLLDRDAVPPRSTVITIDDGFYSVYSHALPILKRYGFPATVYVTTFYALEQNPVFNLAVQYLFWKTAEDELDLAGLGMPASGTRSLRGEGEKTAVLGEIIRFGNDACDEADRVALVRKLAERLGVDYDALARDRTLTILNLDEIRELSEAGIDIELHTHHHGFPLDHDRAVGEVRENRAVLEPILGRRPVHFCYPSGIWAREQWPWLAEAGVHSAVTCDRGLNFKGTPRYGLKRFGDDEGVSQIEFEAEMSGFADVLRAVKRGLRLS